MAEVMFWVIFTLVLVAIFIFTRVRHVRHKVFLVTMIALTLFLYLTFKKVASSHSLEFQSFADFFTALKLYFSWLVSVFDNIKTITGNMIRMDWFP